MDCRAAPSAIISRTSNRRGSHARHILASRPPILVRPEENRPQPRLDRMTGSGMSTVVGRVRPDSIFDARLVVLSHNTIRGAAGGSIFNAELLVKLGYINGVKP